ncbi:MAG: glycosyltransferase family 4 protein [Flavobacteriales bacterium]|nr:glycosyltransferase family 4 protein [Flavobacteriales bacterium]
MKIGFDAKRAFFNNTGLGNYSRDTIRILGKYFNQNEYHLYTPQNIHNNRLDFLNNQSQYHIHEPHTFLSKTFKSFWRTFTLKYDLEKDDITLFHGLSHEIPLGIHNTNIKSIVSIHDLIAIRFPQYFKRFDRISYINKSRYACQHADKIIAVSQQTKEDIVRFFEIDEKKIDVVYQGCNTIFQSQLPNSYKDEVVTKHQLAAKYLLYVGTIEDRKNLLTILKCLKELPNYNLVVIGSGGKYKQKCLSYIKKHNLASQVTFLSKLDLKEMAAIYQKAELLIYPSFFEGFGIPILEALFSEVPVITTLGGCFSEAGGPSTAYINPSNIKEMKSEIVDICSNPTRRKKMIEEGKNHAQKFTDDKIAEQLMKVYQSI